MESPELIQVVSQAPLAAVLVWLLLRTDRRMDDMYRALEKLAERITRLCVLVDTLQRLTVDEMRDAKRHLNSLEEVGHGALLD